MRKASGICRASLQGQHFRRFILRHWPAICLVSLAAAPVPGLAQKTSSGGRPVEEKPSERRCFVFAVDEAKSVPRQLRAICQGVVLLLGPVTKFYAVTSEVLQATLVDAHLGDVRRVLLLTAQDDGQPLVEDLSGQIAVAAGRGPMTSIDRIELDFEEFAKTGDIGVRGQAEDRTAAKADRINLGEQIAFERAHRARRDVQN